MKKLLLFDVDGTLVDYSGTVPQSAIDGLKQARVNGHYVFVVTGRTKCRATVGDIEIDGMICGNGAYVEAMGEVVSSQMLSLEDITKITDYLDERNIMYFLEGNDGMYGSRDFEYGAVETYRKYGVKNPTIKHLYPMMVFPDNMHIPNILKVNYILNSYQDYLDFKEVFKDYKCLTWGGKGEAALFGDCALNGIDKAVAVNKLIEHLGVAKEDVYAFGDATVDIPMFECAGTSIAVGSGGDEAKEAASYVTDAVLDDGIYNALKHFELI